MRVIALLPARGGSKRIPRKNLEKVGGVSLVERAIGATQESRHVQATYVSTDDAEISQVALSCGAHVLSRPAELAADDATMEQAVRHFLLFADLADDDIVLILEPTAPLREPDDLDVIADLMRVTSAPAARIVHADKTWVSGCHSFEYFDAGLCCAIRVGSFDGCLFPEGTLLLHRGDARAVDVDTAADLERARALA